MENRICSKCFVESPLTSEFFPEDPRYREGFSTWCRKCRNAAAQKRYVKNIDKERIRHALARKLDPEKSRAKVRKSYKKHAEKRKAYARDYDKKNRAQKSAYRVKWVHEHPFRARQTRAVQKAKQYGVRVDLNTNYWRIYKRDRGICHLCQQKVDRATLTFDHIIPLSKGGAHSPENIAVAHYICNRDKKAQILEKYLPLSANLFGDVVPNLRC